MTDTATLPRSNVIDLFSIRDNPELLLPLANQGISCGFPSPADDYLEESVDLNALLIKNKASTFLGRVKGHSMVEANISEGDVLVIDRASTPSTGNIALCHIDGEFTVKRLGIKGETVTLYPANASYNPIVVSPETSFCVWGIVTFIIHKAK